jgi:hypothetical protein
MQQADCGLVKQLASGPKSILIPGLVYFEALLDQDDPLPLQFTIAHLHPSHGLRTICRPFIKLTPSDSTISIIFLASLSALFTAWYSLRQFQLNGVMHVPIWTEIAKRRAASDHRGHRGRSTISSMSKLIAVQKLFQR